MTVPDVSSDLSDPNANSTVVQAGTSQVNETANRAVPEFGPISVLVLMISIVSITLISIRTRIKL